MFSQPFKSVLFLVLVQMACQTRRIKDIQHAPDPRGADVTPSMSYTEHEGVAPSEAVKGEQQGVGTSPSPIAHGDPPNPPVPIEPVEEVLPSVVEDPDFCARSKKVMAFYYAWFNPQSLASSTGSRINDIPKLGYYDSNDDAVLIQHVEQAMNHGIDGFIISWVGEHSDPGSNKTHIVLGKLLKIANTKKFCLAADFEPLFMRNNFKYSDEEIRAQMNILLSTWVEHPRYLKIEDKPAVFFWKNEEFTETYWRSVRQQLPSEAYWIADAGDSHQGVDAAGRNVFDNAHFYSTWWPENQSEQSRLWNDLPGRKRFVTVTPGFNSPNSSYKYGRWLGSGTEKYVSQWQFALNSHADYILITSFNEWPEGSYIEWSKNYGDAYLKLTLEKSQIFKSQ